MMKTLWKKIEVHGNKGNVMKMEGREMNRNVMGFDTDGNVMELNGNVVELIENE